jgi:hypothetical protein
VRGTLELWKKENDDTNGSIYHMKTEVNFSCRAERTLDATTVVEFVPHGVDFR